MPKKSSGSDHCHLCLLLGYKQLWLSLALVCRAHIMRGEAAGGSLHTQGHVTGVLLSPWEATVKPNHCQQLLKLTCKIRQKKSQGQDVQLFRILSYLYRRRDTRVWTPRDLGHGWARHCGWVVSKTQENPGQSQQRVMLQGLNLKVPGLCAQSLRGKQGCQARSALGIMWGLRGTREGSKEYLGLCKRSLKSSKISYKGMKRTGRPPWDCGNGYKNSMALEYLERFSKFRRHNAVWEGVTIHLHFARMGSVLVCSSCCNELQ